MRLPVANVREHAAPPANMLTKRQAETLIFMWSFHERNDQLPPMVSIAKHFNFASPNAAQEHVTALEAKGWLERNELGWLKFSPLTRRAMTDSASADRLLSKGLCGINHPASLRTPTPPSYV